MGEGRDKIDICRGQRGRAFSDILWSLKPMVIVGEEPLKVFIWWQQGSILEVEELSVRETLSY